MYRILPQPGCLTQLPPATIPTTIINLATSTVPFPTGSFSTITINPELIVTTPTSTPPPPPSPIPSSHSSLPTPSISSHSASPTSSSSSRKSGVLVIAGGVVGALAIAAVFGVILIRLRKRRTPHLDVTDEPIATSPATVQPAWASNASAPLLSPHITTMPTSNDARTSTSGWDPSTLPVEVAPASNARQEASSQISLTIQSSSQSIKSTYAMNSSGLNSKAYGKDVGVVVEVDEVVLQDIEIDR